MHRPSAANLATIKCWIEANKTRGYAISYYTTTKYNKKKYHWKSFCCPHIEHEFSSLKFHRRNVTIQNFGENINYLFNIFISELRCIFCATSQHIVYLTITHANLLSAAMPYYFNIMHTLCILEASYTQLANWIILIK